MRCNKISQPTQVELPSSPPTPSQSRRVLLLTVSEQPPVLPQQSSPSPTDHETVFSSVATPPQNTPGSLGSTGAALPLSPSPGDIELPEPRRKETSPPSNAVSASSNPKNLKPLEERALLTTNLSSITDSDNNLGVSDADNMDQAVKSYVNP